MKEIYKKMFSNIDIEGLAEASHAVEAVAEFVGFNLSSLEERIMMFIWVKIDIEKALLTQDPQLVEIYSDFIQDEINKQYSAVNNKTTLEKEGR